MIILQYILKKKTLFLQIQLFILFIFKKMKIQKKNNWNKKIEELIQFEIITSKNIFHNINNDELYKKQIKLKYSFII